MTHYFNNNQLDFNSNNPLSYNNNNNDVDADYYSQIQKRNPNIDYINNHNEEDYMEQLDYLNHNNEQLFKQQNANPLIYQNLNEKYMKARTKSKNKRKSSRPNKKSKTAINSTKPTKTKTNTTIGGSGINNLSKVGLFDPGLRKNELGLEKRTTQQKLQRFEKIKNYDIKHGLKTKSFQMYTNPVDMLEDLSNVKNVRELQKVNPDKMKNRKVLNNPNEKGGLKNSKSNNINNNMNNTNNNIHIQQISYSNNNLNFNFENKEQIIKDLERQIEYERKLRLDTNMKYLKKSKELESNKLGNILGSKVNVKTNKKSKRLLRSYTNDKRFKTRKNFVNSKYKNDINKSIDVLMKGMPGLQLSGKRSKSEMIKSRMKEIKPMFEKILENDMNKIVQEMMKKYTKGKLSKSKSPPNKMSKHNPSHSNIGSDLYPNNALNTNNAINVLSPTSSIHPHQNVNIMSGSSMFSPLSTNISKGGKPKDNRNNMNNMNNMNNVRNISPREKQMQMQPMTQSQDYNRMQYNNNYNNINNSQNMNIVDHYQNQPQTSNKFVILNSNNIEAKMLQDLTNRKELEKFSKMNNFDIIQNIHSEIDRYNKGIPQLIQKVENTIEKINQNRVLDKNLHPILSFASKNAGQVIYLHLEEITASIIDDLLLEAVFSLSEMEQQEKSRKEKHQFAKFIGSYYDNVSLMRNFEKDVEKKITDKDYNKPKKRLEARMLAEDVKLPKSSGNTNDKNIEYKNPFEIELDEIRKNKLIKDNFSPEIINQNQEIYPRYSGQYHTSIHPKLLERLNSYPEQFKDYQETTGTFIIPKIFLFYDNFVETNINILFDQEIEKYLLAQIDNIAEEIYRSETLIK